MTNLAPFLTERFWRHVVVRPGDECWGWNGLVNRNGYGRLEFRKGNERMYAMAHRCSFELHVGPIPRGLWVLHRCDNPPCCNPEHLFLGTHADNMRDAYRKGRVRNLELGPPATAAKWLAGTIGSRK